MFETEENLPQPFSQSGSSRLARGDHPSPRPDQSLLQQSDLGALPGPFGPLKGDKKFPTHYFSLFLPHSDSLPAIFSRA